jgi:DNA-directed RNA polymerase subunit RPC12/RpoP
MSDAEFEQALKQFNKPQQRIIRHMVGRVGGRENLSAVPSFEWVKFPWAGRVFIRKLTACGWVKTEPPSPFGRLSTRAQGVLYHLGLNTEKAVIESLKSGALSVPPGENGAPRNAGWKTVNEIRKSVGFPELVKETKSYPCPHCGGRITMSQLLTGCR